MDADKGLPALIAFDLDYTLWDLWIDTHVTGPLKASGSPNLILDRFGEPIFFYPDVPGILHEVHGKTTLALCSRTSAPDLAREALRLLMIPPASTGGSNASPTPATEFFTQKEIYPGISVKATLWTIPTKFQDPRYNISELFTRRRAYPIQRWYSLRPYSEPGLIYHPAVL
ncbi:SubName: Full=Uncharacterized protein {ECO:0000313/EMBL:CCA72021.1} [Serendipita indica DSM 11827]|nr:SubName: Full=Uncharacterized protein {ECO:0000313/EMBL:CCA72021.1} [Serendipita indica DSM 11827]